MKSLTNFMDSFGAILLAIIWISPLLFAFWAATHSTSDAVNLNLFSPWTLENFRIAWAGAPWLKYFINTFMLVTVILIGQFVLTTLAGFAFAQLQFPRQGLRVHIGADAVVYPAGSLDRGELRRDLSAWVVRYDPWRRYALHGQCVRHFPDAAGVQGRPD